MAGSVKQHEAYAIGLRQNNRGASKETYCYVMY